MAESIGLIERAAALLRQQGANEPRPSLAPAAEPALFAPGPQLTLDRGRLASFGIAIPSSARSRTVEEFRLVKRNLMAAWSQNDLIGDRRSGRLIMITSARPGEGKTFTSINLALAFASERDVKALLVDIDTQHPGLPKIFGIPGDKGIVDVLAGSRELSEVLIQTNLPNLMLLPAGRGGPHVPELLSSREMGGQIVFVVEAHSTQQVEIEAALSMLSACPQISLLLNKSDTLASEHFGSYGYYYHSPDDGNDELRSANPA